MKHLLQLILITLVLIATMTFSGATVTSMTIANFNTYPNGRNLSQNLVLGPDNNYYGTTESGGDYNGGTIFKLTPDGQLTNLVAFNPATTGSGPSQLILGKDGNLYGIISPAVSGGGHIFKSTLTGQLTSLFTNGAPLRFIQGNDSYLYVTIFLSSYNWQLFKVSPTTGVSTLVINTIINSPGTGPLIPQFQAQDGTIYGTTPGEKGGVSGAFVLQANPTTGTYATKAFFPSDRIYTGLLPGPNGLIYAATNTSIVQITPALGAVLPIVNFPSSIVPTQIVLGSDGNFYGTGRQYNPVQGGVVFKAPRGAGPTDVTILSSSASNASPNFFGLVQAANGDLIWETDGNGSIEQYTGGVTTALFSFGSGLVHPMGPLVQDALGNVYGTASGGGLSGLGGIYKATASGQVTTLGSFAQSVTPLGLVQGTDGSLYGVAGGVSNSPTNGIFFKVSTAGVMTNIPATFPGIPGSPIVVGSDGKFYGLTNTGGAFGLGTFYQILPTGNVNVICSLDSTMSIAGPYAFPLQQVVVGKDKNFFGATPVALFRIPAPPPILPTGTIAPVKPVVLQSFSPDGVGGAFAPTDLIANAADGDIYGTSLFGGTQNQGFLFKMTPRGTLTNLLSLGAIQVTSPDFYSASPFTIQAGGPTSVALGHDGDIYVIANGGFGIDTNHTYIGALVQIGSVGVRQVPFASTPGDSPNSIIQATDGTLYGTTEMGGTASSGALFNVDPGLLGGTIIGTAGTYNIKRGNNTIEKVFDDDISTYFDAPSPGNGDWVGLDLETPQTITAIAYAPRKHFKHRMIGGLFQGSNTADFSSGVVNLALPITHSHSGFNAVPVFGAAAYRYVRYLSPVGGYGNISELQFYSDGVLLPRSGAGG